MSIETSTASPRPHELRPVPGDGGLPVIGYTRQFVNGELTTSRERYDRYGPVSWLRAFGIKIVTAQGPDACAEVLQNRSHAYASGPGWSFLIGPFFHRGLMLLDSDEHHAHRRIMQQAFTAERLAGYLQPMNDTASDALARWQVGDRFSVYPAVKQLTLDVATRTFMGADLGDEADALSKAFVDCVRAGTAAVRFPVPGLRWSRGLVGREVLEEYLRPRVAQARRGTGRDLLTALCHARGEDGEQFTDEDVVNHMIFLLMAAHDTATITVTTMAYYLAKHPEWQERCRAESLALGTDQVGFDELDRLEALDLVMKETMRLITPVPGLIRKTVRETELMGYRIPKHVRQRQSVRRPSPQRALAGPGPIRPRTLRAGPARGQGASQRLDALRLRRPQVHRTPLRRHGGQGVDAPDAAAVPVEHSRWVHHARRLELAPPAPRRPAGDARTAVTRSP